MNFMTMDVYYIRETEKAYMVRMVVDDSDVWFPKKLVLDLVSDIRQGIQRIQVAEFILKQKGILKDYDVGTVYVDMMLCQWCGGDQKVRHYPDGKVYCLRCGNKLKDG